MNIDIKYDDTEVVMTVTGRVDTIASPEFERQIQPLLGMQGINLTVDVSQMDYISSSGLRCFITLLKSLNANDGTMSILGMTPGVREIFDMTGFSSLFMVIPNLGDDMGSSDDFPYYLAGKRI